MMGVGCTLYCWYCNCLLTDKTRSVDHFIPYSRGGSDRPGNLVAACKRCNSSKANKTLSEWLLRNALARVSETRDELLPQLQKTDFECIVVGCTRCPEVALWTQYAAFDRFPIHGRVPSYVDLPPLSPRIIRHLRKRYGPSPDRYCRKCRLSH